MGVSFRHGVEPEQPRPACCPQWDYPGFGLFRSRLAAAEGLDLDEMQGYSKLDWSLHDSYQAPGTRSWDEATTDLKPLLNHSDCDGEMTPEECALVVPRLREILVTWDADDPTFDYDLTNGLLLATCMETCARENTNLEFG